MNKSSSYPEIFKDYEYLYSTYKGVTQHTKKMRTDIHIGIFDLFIFLGIFQGLLLAWFFIKNGKADKKANLYQGLLMLFLSFGIFEELLNNTGYIVQVLPITNFSEPFNFTFAPLFYLYVKSSLNPKERQKIWGHFILAIFWLFYMYFVFFAPDEVKYNSYIQTKHPDWEYLIVGDAFDDDPLGIRYYTNHLMLIQFIVYMIASIMLILRKFKSLEEPLFRTENKLLITLRNTIFHFLAIIAVFIVTKIVFGMRSDIGGYWIATYISFMIYATIYNVLNRSDFFNQPASFLTFPILKYKKSSLTEEEKEKILSKIEYEFQKNQYYLNNLASLSSLAKLIKQSSHHVSQVINEKLNQNFFELLATYRVEHAKKLLNEDATPGITVEELADIVGYNSKSSFNSAFKKITGQTPSEYRKSLLT